MPAEAGVSLPDDVTDPVEVGPHPGVNPWVAWFGTVDAPRDDADQDLLAVAGEDERAATVSLTGVRGGRVEVAGTHHVLRDLLRQVVAGVPAGLLREDGNPGLLEGVRKASIVREAAPAYNGPHRPGVVLIDLRQAERSDEGGELDTSVHGDHSYVVVVSYLVEILSDVDSINPPELLRWTAGPVRPDVAEDEDDVGRSDPVEAVSCREEEPVGEEGAGTEYLGAGPGEQDLHCPGMGARRGLAAIHHPALLVRPATAEVLSVDSLALSALGPADRQGHNTLRLSVRLRETRVDVFSRQQAGSDSQQVDQTGPDGRHEHFHVSLMILVLLLFSLHLI